MKSNLKVIILVIALGLVWAGAANAAGLGPPNLPPAGFAFTGFIQEATLAKQGTNPATPASAWGGTLTVNGIKMIVPDNSIVQMPATAMPWADLFNPSVSHSVGYAPARPNHRAFQTGLALADNPLSGTRAGVAGAVGPFPSYEVSVVGNIVFDSATGTQKYIVALIVPITQQGFNLGSGIVNFIDYTTGRFRVGGIMNNPLSGVLCEINDPAIGADGDGRFGKRHSPDPRFTADTNNPTITTSTGYPCGLPRVAPILDVNGIPVPGQTGDPTRPYTQRPPNNPLNVAPFVLSDNPKSNQPFDPFLPTNWPLKTFVMPGVGNVGPGTPDPRKQVPIMVGDWVDYTGTMFKINPLGPNTAANTFISIHTMNLDLGVYTQPTQTPVYIKCDVALIGTDGLNGPVDPVINAGAPPTALPSEFARRATFEGFCTDAGVFLVDALATNPKFGPVTSFVTTFSVDDTTGNLGPVVPDDTTPALGKGNPSLIEGNPLGRWIFRASKLIIGSTVPLTREYRAVHSNGTTANVCNGLTGGQFQLPMFEFVTPEHTVQGSPQYPGNYFNLPFLSTLDPFPGTPGGNQPLP